MCVLLTEKSKDHQASHLRRAIFGPTSGSLCRP